jgi:hypothetical protein
LKQEFYKINLFSFSNVNVFLALKKASYKIDNINDFNDTDTLLYKEAIIDNSIIDYENYQMNKDNIFEISGNIEAADIESARWLCNIKPLFPNLNIKSNNILNKNKEFDVDLLICNIQNIKKCKKIFVLEFINYELNQNQINILNNCDKIFTNSINNAQLFRKILNKNNIEYIKKDWAIPNDSKYNIKNQTFVINRNDNITNELVKKINPENLLFFNYRTKNNVKCIPNYVKYENLFQIIQESNLLIDLNTNNNYSSGLIDLFIHLGKNVITNNSGYCVAKPKVFYIKSKIKDGEIYPNLDNLENIINESNRQKISKYNFDIFSLNKQINASLISMLKE